MLTKLLKDDIGTIGTSHTVSILLLADGTDNNCQCERTLRNRR